MDDLIEERVITETINYDDKKSEKSEKIPLKPSVSRCTSFLCFTLFLLLGICHYLPISFFAVANNFWLHKFRNTSDPDESAENRTRLQVNFATAGSIITTIAGLLFGLFNITLSHRFRIVRRIVTCLSIQLVIFVLLTISVEVNTNNVQVLYFVAVLSASGTLAAANTVNILATTGLFSRFPRPYMSICLVGQGVSGIIGDILNIISIGIFKNYLIKGTLVYFSMVCFVITLTMVLFIVTSRTEFFQEGIASVPEEVHKKMHSFKEMKTVLYKVRYPLIVLLYYVLTQSFTHTSVTSLVVSEQADQQTVWAVTYFSPVMTFLLSDVCVLVGRLLVGVTNFNMPKKVFYIVGPIRMALLLPFIWMCNAQPRTNMPVLFPHDYQYGIILGVFMLTNGLILHWALMEVPKVVEKHEADVAYPLFMFTVNVFDMIASPIALLIVNYL